MIFILPPSQIFNNVSPFFSRSAFFWFSQDERKKVREANPKFGVGEVAKELGRRWADIDPVLKKKYEGLAEEDRKRYSQAKTDYKNSLKGGSAKKGLSSPTGSAVPPLSEPSLSNYNRSGSLVLPLPVLHFSRRLA